ncbi:MAG: efflux RND transporter periplasmic adaptor subunit [Desulfobacteraceae bacterium]|nr:efflux RND transporter periplasmic adaptor subunit [Desulfobacteraceae bacterium]
MTNLSRALIGVILILLSGCDSPSVPKAITSVRVVSLEYAHNNLGRTYSGQIVPATQVDVAFRTDGYIKEITKVKGVDGAPRILQTGDVVTKGKILAKVTDEQYRDQVASAKAQLIKAKAALIKAKADFGRARALKAQDSITAPNYDSAQQEYSTAKAEVDSAAAQLDATKQTLGDTLLIAPLKGVILQRNIEVGSLVHSGTTGFTMADTSMVKAQFGVPDMVLANISKGDTIGVRTASYPKKVFQGVVSEISEGADPRTRVFQVYVKLNNPQGLLRVGMVASVEVAVGSKEPGGILVPIRAVVKSKNDGFGVYVIVKKDGQTLVKLRSIEAGSVFGNKIHVLSGVQAGDKIVVGGTAQVVDNQQVNVVP